MREVGTKRVGLGSKILDFDVAPFLNDPKLTFIGIESEFSFYDEGL